MNPGTDLQNILRVLVRLSEVYRKIELSYDSDLLSLENIVG